MENPLAKYLVQAITFSLCQFSVNRFLFPGNYLSITLGSPPQTCLLLDKLFELYLSVRDTFFHSFIILKVLLRTHSDFSTSFLPHRCCILSPCSSSNHSALDMRYTHLTFAQYASSLVSKRLFPSSLLSGSNPFFLSTDKKQQNMHSREPVSLGCQKKHISMQSLLHALQTCKPGSAMLLLYPATLQIVGSLFFHITILFPYTPVNQCLFHYLTSTAN